MIYFRFSSRSSGKIEIGSLDLLDLLIWLEEDADGTLTWDLAGVIPLVQNDSGTGIKHHTWIDIHTIRKTIRLTSNLNVAYENYT